MIRVMRPATVAALLVIAAAAPLATAEDIAVRLTITTPHAEYHMGDPIYVDLIMRSDRATPFEVYQTDVIIDYDFIVKMPDGKQSPLTRYGQWTKEGGMILSGKTFSLDQPTALVHASIFLNHRFDMSYVGTYEVTAKQTLHRTDGKGPDVVITSNTLKIKIGQPATRPAEETTDPTTRPAPETSDPTTRPTTRRSQ